MSTSILVIDEDPDLQELIVETLEAADYVAIGASSSQEALKFLRQRRFDIAITQVRVTRTRNDIATVELLKEKSPGLHCIIITQHDSLEQLSDSFKEKVDQFVFKPLQMQAILDAVKRLKIDSKPTNSMWAAVLAMPKKLLQKADAGRRDHALQALQSERQRSLRGFHAGIHSGQLSVGAALDCWDRLGLLEREAEKLFEAEEPTLAEVQSLSQRYHQTFELMISLAQSKSQGTLGKRAPEDVNRATFQRFFDRIRSTLILADQMEWAWSAWTSRHSNHGDSRGGP